VGSDTHHVEVAADRRWDLTTVLDRLPDLRGHGVSLQLEVLDASRETLRLRVTSSMSVSYEGGWDSFGLHIADALMLPDQGQQLVNWVLRKREVALSDVVAYTGQDQQLVRARLSRLVKDGYLGEVLVGEEVRYRARLARRHRNTLPDYIWQVLTENGASQSDPQSGLGARTVARRIRDGLLGDRGRFVLAVTPVFLVFALSEWLLFTGSESFAAPLSYGGVITATLVGGIFPVLMLIAARRKAELVPGLVLRFLGHPLVVTAIYLLFVANLFLHGLVIWSGVIEQASALVVGLLAVAVTIVIVRRGAFTPRAVVELRHDQREGDTGVFAVTVKGEPAVANVRLQYADGERTCQEPAGRVPQLSLLRQAVFQLPATSAKELKVWAHVITRDGQSERLPAVVDISCGGESTRHFDLRLAGEQVLVPLTSSESTVQITLPKAWNSPR
jgi:hypothetical protein